MMVRHTLWPSRSICHQNQIQYCIKTAKCIIMQITPHDSLDDSTEIYLNGCAKYRWGKSKWKIVD